VGNDPGPYGEPIVDGLQEFQVYRWSTFFLGFQVEEIYWPGKPRKDVSPETTKFDQPPGSVNLSKRVEQAFRDRGETRPATAESGFDAGSPRLESIMIGCCTLRNESSIGKVSNC
jgi:hypothetical protein